MRRRIPDHILLRQSERRHFRVRPQSLPILFSAALCIAVGTPARAIAIADSDEHQSTSGESPAEALFSKVEHRLLAAEAIHLQFEITATGRFPASLAGSMVLAKGNRIRLDAAGTFNGEPTNIKLISNGSHMRLVVGTEAIDMETPKALNEGVLIGLTRMGLLHNLARLTSKRPPDRTDGTARDWVQVSEIDMTDVKDVPSEEAKMLTFKITVSKFPVGDASLVVDSHSGKLMRRKQTVRFPGGEFQAEEVYTDLDLAASPDPATFTIDATP